ncbi:uncharacterized protein LOC127266567 isoform X1 [Andrographis paniculata]|uniref:uncharacterized protein LOC127266567 isoform X1 n=1 Tax=Andrographis paniculata TaxID=175694 RepID=UPI0021E6EF46|nr:uncharacterized protein LOC127266567 isoform X1 [Andrographis paniculata]
MDGRDADNSKQSTDDMTTFVQNLLQQMQTRFQTMSESIISKIDEMGNRIDELEQSINDLRTEMGQDGAASPSPTSKAREETKTVGVELNCNKRNEGTSQHHTHMAESLSRCHPTKLEYFHDMFKLQASAAVLSSFANDQGTQTLVLDSTIFHPQGGGQPSDKGFISNPLFTFVVEDVRSKDQIVYHYGHFENTEDVSAVVGAEVLLRVDEDRRRLNSRLHSAGHLLDICVRTVGWDHLEPTKGYHFPDGPFVEYKGTVPPNELQEKQKEIELEANRLISEGGNVSVSILPYNQASELCGGSLPDYIPKESSPRIVQLGKNPGCPCGGTHVGDLSEISSLKVSQIRAKKGHTKVFYNCA